MAETMGFAGWSAVVGTWITIAGASLGGWTILEQQKKEQAGHVKETVVETYKMFEIFNRTEQLAARAAIYKEYYGDHVPSVGTAAQAGEGSSTVGDAAAATQTDTSP